MSQKPLEEARSHALVSGNTLTFALCKSKGVDEPFPGNMNE